MVDDVVEEKTRERSVGSGRVGIVRERKDGGSFFKSDHRCGKFKYKGETYSFTSAMLPGRTCSQVQSLARLSLSHRIPFPVPQSLNTKLNPRVNSQYQ